jgi:arylsulfatase A-like enzyme
VQVAPVEVSLAPTQTVAGDRPHIFLIVMDSLRRDYVGVYNNAVTFTPALDAFGRENVVFDRAFTRYGATGLAVPSIWAGGMLLHKQYVTPFAPMNTLARLLNDQGYAQWVGMDNIMDVILPESTLREPLDARRMVKDFRSCQTLAEIRSRLAQPRTVDRPVFAYTLPQDIHVSTLTREGRNVVDGERYDGFDAPVASRIRAFDRCFGEFIADLKARKLYDDSVVIVTSDHGDSLGEAGRMGHAYTLYPEIVQIPLLVHLPARLSSELQAENEGTVFSTDITPTLYALLGAVPHQPRPFFGRPLFRARGTRPRDIESRPPVLAASYGAVYGALLARGRTLYVLDTINMREHAFTLDGSGSGVSAPVDAVIRSDGQTALRATVEDIADFYKFVPVR